MSLLQEKDKKYLWHPYTQAHDYLERDLLMITGADGLFLTDEHGRRYYDTISSWWCVIHGHRHPTVTAAVRDQLDRLDHVLLAGTSHEPAVLLAEQLVKITPDNLTRVFFSDNGSTACEIAVKMSFQYWQHRGETRRKRFVALERGYHGDTIGTMSLGGVAGFHGAFEEFFFPSHRIPSPYCYRCPFSASPESCGAACVEPLAKLLAREGETIAGLILEPMLQAAGGMIVYPAAYLVKAAALCRQHGIHLILDEVATGFGRTGKMFALEHAGVRPDFLCLSKGLTNGCLPMAATLTTDGIHAEFCADYRENRTFYHGHTFTGNPLAAAAALGSLQVFASEPPWQRLAVTAPHLACRMEAFRDLPWVGDVRGIGMVAAIELVRDKNTREPFAFADRVGWPIYLAGLKEGVILRPLGNIIYLWLPLSVSTGDIDEIVDRVWRVLADPANIGGWLSRQS